METVPSDEIPRVDVNSSRLPTSDEKESGGRLTAKDEIGGVKFDCLGKEYVWVTPESLSSK